MRANRVRAKLIELGINKNKIRTYGLGFSQPIYPYEFNEFVASQNRRVEIIFVEK
jgi:outer membrane protein OmpA-like peptidoglycan-associated protein